MALVHAQQAQPPYTVLVPLPGTTTNCNGSDSGENNDCTTTFNTYLPAIFNLSIGIAAALAFVMISYGGFQLMTTDSINGKTEGRKKVQDAVWGLLLVIGAYAILYTINPQLLNFNLNIGTPTYGSLASGMITVVSDTPSPGATGGGGVLAGYALTQAQIDDNNATTAKLSADSGGQITPYQGPCTQGQTTACVDLNNLPQNAVTGLENLQKDCSQSGTTSCAISITGGTEGGHVAHGPNIPVLDLSSQNSPALNSWIVANGTVQQTNLGPQYTVNTGGVNATFLHESSPDHWHVTYQ